MSNMQHGETPISSEQSIPSKHESEAREHQSQIPTRFAIAELVCHDGTSPTGLREEIVLCAWLICLLRTSEDGKASFEWAYESQIETSKLESDVMTLSSDKVLPVLKNEMDSALEEISRHVSRVKDMRRSTEIGCSSLVFGNRILSTCEDSRVVADNQIRVFCKDGHVNVCPRWASERVQPSAITQQIDALVCTIELCLKSPKPTLETLLGPTDHDLEMIWRWNHDLPPTYDFCMHDVISERSREFPSKEAIASWDGHLTYSEVENFSSHLACQLHAAGVALHDFIPVCFEKSRWTVVAVLAVMKAGGTLVLMDPTLPLARLQNMARQVNAKRMISSRAQEEIASLILPEGSRFIVDMDSFAQISESEVVPKIPPVPTLALMYVIFTSGSTGTPKGVKISHRTYTSSAIPRAAAVGYTQTSRVLDFASYAFDVSIDSMLLTLANGGCLCIPSDEDRLNDINHVIRKMRINYAGITPSMARILDADVIKSLDVLGLGGEAASATDVNSWGKDTRIVIGYGPCECTIGCTINSSAATGKDYISIGQGNGAAIWIVDPNNHEALLPVGAVGELLVEGPIVGQGYLDDPEKTAAAFIHDPSWLVAGHKQHAGRKGRLYKTGDLGMFDPDGYGGIVFVGRKDTQVKLRGQRVELGEIESQLNKKLPPEATVVAEVIAPKGAGNQSTLVAFVSFCSAKGQEHTDISSVELTPEQSEALSSANTEITRILPRYMIPTAYLPVNYVPTLISGKTDRKRLRLFGMSVDLRETGQEPGRTASRELSGLEKSLKQAWSQVLKVDAETILSDDNFFALGGDSLAAMRLVSICRGHGVDLSVTKIFDHPILAAMAENASLLQENVKIEVDAFSMIAQPVESACMAAAHACDVPRNAIEDIYPSTPTQESLFTFSLKSTEAYVAQRVACIPVHIEIDEWKKAWEAVVAASPILRSRLVQLQDPGLQQVVLKENIQWSHHEDLESYLEDDRMQKMHLGQSLARYAIVDDLRHSKRFMVWTVHHVLYDGWSEPLILEKVRSALGGSEVKTDGEMKNFVKFVHETNESDMREFWRQELNAAVGPQFPRLPYRDYLPKPKCTIERSISFNLDSRSPFTLATFIRAAWALVASQYMRSDDVVFGETLTGRDVPLPGVESIIGPLIATVPIRIRVARNSTVEAYLQAVQKSVLARAPFQHMGMQNIRKVSEDAQHACEAGTGLVIQPEPDYEGDDLGFSQGDVVHEALHFNPYPLMLACGIRKGGFRVCANFDCELVAVRQMERTLAQLEATCCELAKDLSRTIDQISCVHEDEMNEIWRRNQLAPLSLDRSARKLRAEISTKPGSSYPPPLVQWICNLRNPSLLAPIGCPGELWLEGDCLSGEILESPTWLQAGSSQFVGRQGKTQATGDIVQQQEDGTIVFLGRKDDVLVVNGQVVDLADLETHLSRCLPSFARAVVGVIEKPNPTLDEKPHLSLVVFVTEQRAERGLVSLLPECYEITKKSESPASMISVCASASTELVLAMKRLEKMFRDSLPAHMVPSSYIVLDTLPPKQHDINQIAAMIPDQIIERFQQGLQEVWNKSLSMACLSDSEQILRLEWANVLGMNEHQIEMDDNFFRLGGDSVLAMKLVSSLRNQGHTLTIADIFQYMRLSDAAKRLKLGNLKKAKTQPYRHFSLVDPVVADHILSDIRQSKLVISPDLVQDVYPVTDSQALDIRGTIETPRTSVQYNMLYFNNAIDCDRLHRACQELVMVHDILRTVFVEKDGRFFQVVLSEADASVITHQTDGELASFVNDLCEKDIGLQYPLGSMFFKFIHAVDGHGKECLILGLSHALYDGVSLPRLLQDLEALYCGRSISKYEPFSSYMTYKADSRHQAKSLGYWSTLLDGSSLSILDGISGQLGNKGVFKSKVVESFQPVRDITLANVLSAAWALLLARRLRKPDVTFGSVTSGRMIDLVNVEHVVGPCYQLTPIRVKFQPNWTAADLLHSVQKQSAESAAHDFLGFEQISRQCTSWTPDIKNFDSIVHHQDFDDFDSMNFAEGSCRVEVSNPHGDAPLPFKTVSFLRGENVHVGAVGSETDSELVSEILDDLASIFAEISRCPDDILLDAAIF
ncbi:hypothetical protein PDE_03416 [Penicillium oxalicum 114-2]|uniref:Carrier domain-containing protein n=1 Tax=Penicillium oxalicum (strain 114-2 / CGMCC 5302) TaxID=933388 RepID=S7ZCV8_PENO1|nr:hypothetical protein PDE_03416 [Penicillium oxalicum 114-2]